MWFERQCGAGSAAQRHYVMRRKLLNLIAATSLVQCLALCVLVALSCSCTGTRSETPIEVKKQDEPAGAPAATPGSAPDGDVTPVPVVSYLAQADFLEHEGKRVAALLQEQGIRSFVGDRIFDQEHWAKWTEVHGSDSVVIFVPRELSIKARLLLARAMKDEGLRIELRNDSGNSVAAEAILTPSKP